MPIYTRFVVILIFWHLRGRRQPGLSFCHLFCHLLACLVTCLSTCQWQTFEAHFLNFDVCCKVWKRVVLNLYLCKIWKLKYVNLGTGVVLNKNPSKYPGHLTLITLNRVISEWVHTSRCHFNYIQCTVIVTLLIWSVLNSAQT